GPQRQGRHVGARGAFLRLRQPKRPGRGVRRALGVPRCNPQGWREGASASAQAQSCRRLCAGAELRSGLRRRGAARLWPARGTRSQPRVGLEWACLAWPTGCSVIAASSRPTGLRASASPTAGTCTATPASAKISEFQENHRKRLLAFYREKISRLEESLRKSVLQIEQLQRVESMDVGLSPSPVRKPEIAAGPSRISMISPPQDGRMGSVSSRGPEHPSLTPSQRSVGKPLRIPPLQIPYKGPSLTPTPQLPNRLAGGGSPSFGGSQAGLPPRLPISISNLLQRQCSGKCSASLGKTFLGKCMCQGTLYLGVCQGQTRSSKRSQELCF
uniref:Ring finger protein 212 n=1 Tax=Callithrix jacchus TaxID=9483 RepID=A0A8I3XDT2_CALJA